MMVVALTLLLLALGFALYRDRDFWIPETQEAVDQSQGQPQVQTQDQPAPPVVAMPDSPVHKNSHGAKAKPKVQTQPQPAPPVVAMPASPVHKNSHGAKAKPRADARAEGPAATSAPPVTTIRTVLPPLEVEVVAGNVHRMLRPGTNSVRVDLQPDSSPHPVPDAPAGDATDTAASLTTEAAEHVQISSDTAEIVSRPVKPSYPLLARQMKVQGSVILQALISRNGVIQDLRVVSGPPILASAAQEAVKQWHFKPHLQGTEPVET